jgi:cephalosporin hydroxylase
VVRVVAMVKGPNFVLVFLAVSGALNVALTLQLRAQAGTNLFSGDAESYREELDQCVRHVESLKSQLNTCGSSTSDAGDSGGKEGNDASPDAPLHLASEFGAEVGFDALLEKKAVTTLNTRYDPSRDTAWVKLGADRYTRSSWTPKPSMEIRVSDDKWISMAELTWAYDVWYEEYSAFSATHWMGIAMQQDPQDMLAIHDMVWRVKPDLIIELGTNTGGSAVFLSSITRAYNPNAKIITVDVKPVSDWNEKQSSRMCPKCAYGPAHRYWHDGGIVSLLGDVGSNATLREVIGTAVRAAKVVLAIDDASHLYESTYANIRQLSKWVTAGSYMLVQDTKLDRLFCSRPQPTSRRTKRPMPCQHGPMRAVDAFMSELSRCPASGGECREMGSWVIDRSLEHMMYSQHHRGFLLKK